MILIPKTYTKCLFTNYIVVKVLCMANYCNVIYIKYLGLPTFSQHLFTIHLCTKISSTNQSSPLPIRRIYISVEDDEQVVCSTFCGITTQPNKPKSVLGIRWSLFYFCPLGSNTVGGVESAAHVDF